jgi:hypothetical protein
MKVGRDPRQPRDVPQPNLRLIKGAGVSIEIVVWNSNPAALSDTKSRLVARIAAGADEVPHGQRGIAPEKDPRALGDEHPFDSAASADSFGLLKGDGPVPLD